MNPSPVSDTPQAAASDVAASEPRQPTSLPASGSVVTSEFNVLCYTLLSLFVITFTVWVIFAWKDYGHRYAPISPDWYRGGTHSVELTVVREDAQDLVCASDVEMKGLHCARRADGTPFDPPTKPTPDRVLLRPYSTVDQKVFLASGLWTSPGMAAPLPDTRFTVVCNFHMVGVLKSVGLQWAPKTPFAPMKNALPVGTFSDCMIPP